MPVCSRTPHTLIDQKKRMLCMLVGRPSDPNWMSDVVEPAAQMLDDIRLEGDAMGAWSAKQLNARRGDFVSITSGVSYGGGQQVRSGLCFACIC